MSFIAADWRRPALAAIAFACATSAFAAEGTTYRAVSASQIMAARQSALVNAQTLNPSPTAKRQAVKAASTAQPTEIFANPFRAYPPSCLGDGLPFRSFPQSNGDPAPQQQTLNLPGDPGACLPGGDSQECATNYVEPVTVTVWRVACSNNQTAVLLEIDRSAAQENNTTRYPTFPAVALTQSGNSLYPVRLVNDPNTIFANTLVNTAIYNSDIYVLENYFSDTTIQVDYAKAFVLTLDNTISFTFPDYNKSLYAASNQTLPISGYLSTNWYNPLQSGEGMLTQIYDGDASKNERFFTAAWYTFDALGAPFWLFAQGTIHIGDRSANNVKVVYPNNGKFAGSGATTNTDWGTANFSFPDCNTMVFSYSYVGPNGQPNAPSSSGTRTWSRLANINSVVCN
jgi:hypothetical protein